MIMMGKNDYSLNLPYLKSGLVVCPRVCSSIRVCLRGDIMAGPYIGLFNLKWDKPKHPYLNSQFRNGYKMPGGFSCD